MDVVGACVFKTGSATGERVGDGVIVGAGETVGAFVGSTGSAGFLVWVVGAGDIVGPNNVGELEDDNTEGTIVPVGPTVASLANDGRGDILLEGSPMDEGANVWFEPERDGDNVDSGFGERVVGRKVDSGMIVGAGDTVGIPLKPHPQGAEKSGAALQTPGLTNPPSAFVSNMPQVTP